MEDWYLSISFCSLSNLFFLKSLSLFLYSSAFFGYFSIRALAMLEVMISALLMLIQVCGSIFPLCVLSILIPADVSITFMSGAFCWSFFIQVFSNPICPTLK